MLRPLQLAWGAPGPQKSEGHRVGRAVKFRAHVCNLESYVTALNMGLYVKPVRLKIYPQDLSMGCSPSRTQIGALQG